MKILLKDILIDKMSYSISRYYVKKRYNDKRKALGLCISCNDKAEKPFVKCRECLNKHNAIKKQNRIGYKVVV